MKFQGIYELHVVEQEGYFSAIMRHCEVSTQEYSFEWDIDEDNEYSSMERTRREFMKFFKKEFHGRGLFIYDFEFSSSKKLEKVYPVPGSYLIFQPLQWHEWLNNWLELAYSSEEDISSEEEELLSFLYKEKFPCFDLFVFHGYSSYEAFGEELASYL